MNESARVTALDALTEFKGSLGAFKAEAQDALCAVEMEIRRTVDWIENQRKFWQHEVREREEEVAEAKLALMNRKMMRFFDRPPDCTEQEENLAIAERRLEEAEEKVAQCKRWLPLVHQAVEEYAGPAHHLADLVEGQLPRGMVLLDRMVAALEAYVGLNGPVGSSQPAPAPAKSEPAKEGGTS